MIKSQLFAALILTTALTAPAAIIPLALSSPAVAGETTSRDFSAMAANVRPAAVNAAVTTNIDSGSAPIAAMEGLS